MKQRRWHQSVHPRAKFGYIWHTKVSWQLLNALDDLELTLPRRDGASEWVGMNRPLIPPLETSLTQHAAKAQQSVVTPLSISRHEAKFL
jgi:hypothetical protein